MDKLICAPGGSSTPTSAGKTFSSAATSWSFTGAEHGLGTCDLTFQIFDGANSAIEPNTFVCNATTKDVTVTFVNSQDGRVVLKSKVTTSFAQSFTAQTSVAIVHNFGTVDVNFACYDGANNAVGPNTVSSATNTLTITFSLSQTGRCVVMK